MDKTNQLLLWISARGYLVALRSDKNVSDAQFWKCECNFFSIVDKELWQWISQKLERDPEWLDMVRTELGVV